MDSYSKYIKYKTKYTILNSISNEMSGGAKDCNDKWCEMVKKRRNELLHRKRTGTFVPYSKLKNASYLVEDNGAQPFKVVVNKKGITIYKETRVANKKSEYKEVILELKKYLGYWSGFDASPYKMHGNSILIQVTKFHYIYVGWDVYEFDTDDEITDFIAYMGNNDVPYPVAYGEKYVYFMLDKKMIKRDDLELEATVANAGELYGEFYGFIGSKKGKHKRYDFKNVKMVHGRL